MAGKPFGTADLQFFKYQRRAGGAQSPVAQFLTIAFKDQVALGIVLPFFYKTPTVGGFETIGFAGVAQAICVDFDVRFQA